MASAPRIWELRSQGQNFLEFQTVLGLRRHLLPDLSQQGENPSS